MGRAWHGWPTASDLSVPPKLGPIDRNRAILEMVGTGAFADTPALERWSETAEALPILRRYLLQHVAPHPTRECDVDLAAAEAEIAYEDALAADIEARFGL